MSRRTNAGPDQREQARSMVTSGADPCAPHFELEAAHLRLLSIVYSAMTAILIFWALVTGP